MDAARLDAALRAQRRQALRIAGMQAHRVAPLAEVGGRGAAAMAGAKDRDRSYVHPVTRSVRSKVDHGNRARRMSTKADARPLPGHAQGAAVCPVFRSAVASAAVI